MKKEKIAGMALMVMNIALIAAGIVLYLSMDRKEPSFEFQAMDIIYEEGMDTSRLLDGIRAYDNKDGDITDKIVVEKLIENRELDSVVVIYGVSDEAGNVAKCSREFPAVFKEKPEEEAADEETVVQDGWLMQSGFWTELEGKDGDKDAAEGNESAGNIAGENDGAAGSAGNRQEENEEGEGSGNGEQTDENTEQRTEGEAAQEMDGETAQGAGEETGRGTGQETARGEDGETARGTGEETGRGIDEETARGTGEGTAQGIDEETAGGADEETAQERDEETARRQQERNAESRNTHDPEAPVLTLKVAEVKTAVGVGPAWVELIGTLSDDKDGYEELFRNLEVSKYDKNQPGTYQVTVSTKDSDGKRSQPVSLTIIVK
jgi:hypothetical protein